MHVGVKSGSDNFFHAEYGIRLMLAPRSASAKHSAIPEKSHGIKNLLGSPNFSGITVSFVASGTFSTTGGEIEGPSYETPLRVVIDFKSLFGLATVLPGKVPELEGDAVAIISLNSFVWLDRDV
uniref:Uncharacterized protein n=1 Tax=Tanacetum cinerariifolium TaxID=118510 RepID=A0A699SGV7_TANCI|nr:hypothetical protein [Tanacetum cinerariifolium]